MAVSFARARVERILRDAGARRLTKDAEERLNEIIVEYGIRIAKTAAILAKQAGRETVNEQDIITAANMSRREHEQLTQPNIAVTACDILGYGESLDYTLERLKKKVGKKWENQVRRYQRTRRSGVRESDIKL